MKLWIKCQPVIRLQWPFKTPELCGNSGGNRPVETETETESNRKYRMVATAQ